MPFFNLPSGGGEGLPVLTGEGAPSDAVGSNGQLYIDTLNGALYVKSAGTWGSGIEVGGAADWAELTGKPTEFPPESHSHIIADVSGLQTALDGLQPAGSYASATHTHIAADITDLSAAVVTSVNGQTGAVTITSESGASTWEEITGKPTTFPPEAHTHLWSEITATPATFPPTAHTHGWSEITSKPTTFPPESHTHQIADVVNLQTLLDGKADDSHGHAIADVTGLQAAIDSKADATHTHEIADVNGLQTALDSAGGVTWSTPPTESTDPGAAGSIAYDTDYLFVAVAENLWKRAPLYEFTVSAITITQHPQDVTATPTAGNVTGFQSFANVPAYDGFTFWSTLGVHQNALVYFGTRYNSTTLKFETLAFTLQQNGNWTTETIYEVSPLSATAQFGPTHGQTAGMTDSGFNIFVINYRQYAYDQYGTQENNISIICAVPEDESFLSQQTNVSLLANYDPANPIEFAAAGNGVCIVGRKDALYVGYAANNFDGFELLGTAPPVTSDEYQGIAFGGGIFVLCKLTTLWTSVNGSAWVDTAATLPNFGCGIAFGNGKFIVICKTLSGQNAIRISTDSAATWTTGDLPIAIDGGSQITFVGGRFVVRTGQQTAISQDGVNWASVVLPNNAYQTFADLSGTLIAAVENPYTSAQMYPLIAATTANAGCAATFSVSATTPSGALSYQWERSLDDGQTWAAITGATANTLSLSGLTTIDSGNKYRVVVASAGQDSVTSNAATLTATCAAPPEAPTGLLIDFAVDNAGVMSTTTLKVEWTAPVNAYGTITDYVIEYTNNGTTKTVNVGSDAEFYYLSDPLNDHFDALFRVAAITTTQGAWSYQVESPTAPQAPPPPQLVEATAGIEEVYLYWPMPLITPPQNQQIVDYLIQYTGPSGHLQIVSTGSADTFYTVLNLVGDVEYEFRVAAVNQIGQGSWSAPVLATPTASNSASSSSAPPSSSAAPSSSAPPSSASSSASSAPPSSSSSA